jgi:squalene-hopene/tetraprenyl-beta-curcumene cyclase
MSGPRKMPSSGVSPGVSACRARTAVGVPLTRTTPSISSTKFPSPILRRSSIRPRFGYPKTHPAAVRGLAYIKQHQEPDGSWWGRWGVNYIYGCWSVISGLAAIGEDLSQPYIRKAVNWLKSRQNIDSGWGESCASYDDPSLAGFGESTPSQTGWALLALMSAGEANSVPVVKGIQYLLSTQKPDGSWDEEQFTGTGFPKFFMIRYHIYKDVFPLMALGTYRRLVRSGKE